MMTNAEQALVVQAAGGDREAFAALIDAYQGLVFAVALNVTGHWADSEDAVQEAFVRAWEKLRTLSDPARFAAWLCTITRREALQILRRRGRVPTLDIDAELANQIPSNAESPAEAYARRQLSEILWAEVGALPARTREAILLFYIENYSIARAAAFLGISDGAFKMRLNYGREQLRESLAEKLHLEINRRRPGYKRKLAILAALPAAVVATSHAASAGSIAGILTVKSAMIATLALVCATTVFISVRSHQSSVSNSAPESIVPAVAQREGSSRTASSNNPIAIPTRQIAAVATFASPAPAAIKRQSVSGSIVDLFTGRPIAGVCVFIGTGSDEQTTRTGKTGAFSFRGVREGDVPLMIGADDPGVRGRYVMPPKKLEILLRLKDRPINELRISLMPTTSLSGRVIDLKGQPVAKATVSVQAPENEAVTDAKGEFTIRGIEPGRRMQFACFADGFYPTTPRTIIAPAGRPANGVIVQMASLADSGAFSGQVVNENGEPVAARPISVSCVHAWPGNARYASLRLDQKIITDAQGRFKMDGVPPGRVTLMVDWWRYYDKRTVSINLHPGEEIKNIPIRVAQSLYKGRLGGQCVDTAGQPIPDAEVVAEISGGYGGPIAMCETDKDGRFELNYLPEQQPVDVSVRAELFFNQSKKIMQGVKPTTENLRLVLTPEPGMPGSDPKALDAMIAKYRSNPPAANSAAAPGHPVERVQLLARDTKRLLVDVVSRPPSLLDIAAASFNKAFEEPIAREMKYGLHIQGRVVDPNGKPITGASVYSSLTTENRQCVTGPDGSFEFQFARTQPPAKNADPNEWLRVLVEHPDSAPFNDNRTVDMSKPVEMNSYVARLEPGCDLVGAVVDREEHGLAAVAVKVTSSGMADLTCYTDEQGVFTAEHLAAGRYTVSIENPFSLSRMIDVEPSGTNRIMLGEERGGLRGKLTDGVKPLVAMINLTGMGTSHYAQTMSDAFGEYSFEALPAGRYSFVVTRPGWPGYYGEILEIGAEGGMRRDVIIQPVMMSGTVVRENGAPLASATIILVQFEPPARPDIAAFMKRMANQHLDEESEIYGSRVATTDAQGRFAVKSVPPGNYILIAGKDPNIYATLNLKIENGKNRENLKLTMP